MILLDSTGYFRSSYIPKRAEHGFGTISSTPFISAPNVIIPTQIHSDTILLVEEPGTPVSETDGLITTKRDIILTMRTADCMPIIYADVKHHIIGISHNGWKGSSLRLSSKMINELVSLGADVATMDVALGPCIGNCCYSIPKSRVDELESVLPADEFKAVTKIGEIYSLNLLHLNYMQVLKEGVLKRNIDFFPFCTSCDEKRFYSYRRREGAAGSHMQSYIRLSE